LIFLLIPIFSHFKVPYTIDYTLENPRNLTSYILGKYFSLQPSLKITNHLFVTLVDGVKWLEVGLNKYAEFIQEPSSRIKNVLRNYYYSLHYGYLVQGDTITALKYLQRVREILPHDPEPYFIEASLRMDMGTLNYRIVDSLLASAEKLFNPVSYSFTYPFYSREERHKSVSRKKTNLYRVESRYFINVGNPEKAIESLQRAIEAQGGDINADYGDHEMLGDLLLDSGNIEKAIQHYAFAVVTGSEEENLKKIV